MIHERIEKLRKMKGISKAELARQLGIPATTYSGYSRGVREPDLETVELFARYFDVSVDYLIAGDSGAKWQEGIQRLTDDFIALDKQDQQTILDLIHRMKKK